MRWISFDIPYKIRERNIFWKQAKDVHVIQIAAHYHWIAIQVTTNAANIRLQLLCDSGNYRRLTMFRAENNVDVVLRQWLTHNGFFF